MAAAVLEVARAALAAGGPVDGRRHHQPAGVDHRVGPGDRRARRPRPRLAGPAHRRRLPRAGRAKGCASRPTCRPPRPRTCSTRSTPTAPATCASAPSTPGWCGTCRAASTCTDPSQRRGHRAAHRRRTPDGTPRCSTPLRIPAAALPTIVDSSGVVGVATALDGAPPIAGIAGDQQASLVGQGCVRPGLAKITFGTGGMLDVCVGARRADRSDRQGPAGTFPIVAWRRGGETVGRRGGHAGGGHQRRVAARRPRHHRHGRGVARRRLPVRDDRRRRLRPRPAGPGHPAWDYGARGTLLGLTRGTGRPQIVRAVLEGVAQRGADLVEAAEADTGLALDRSCASTAA